LPDMSDSELLRRIQELGLVTIPIIVYTGKELTKEQETELNKLAKTIIIKGVNSPERLLNETTLFLHQAESSLSPRKKNLIKQAKLSDPALQGRRVLIVDDDIRNIYALVSILEAYSIDTCSAENGRDGIAILKSNPSIDAILMDVMMPEMDGYETMRAIRAMEQFKHLPMIAVTAKAMKGDREKCIESGASDYIAKPVESEELLSLLRVHLVGDPESVAADSLEKETVTLN
jgi:CheY-like chemotaxis protein